MTKESELLDAFGAALLDIWPNGHKRHLLLAVSGGGDSMAMMHLASRWAVKNNFECSVITIDHGLRDESTAEAEFVSRVADVLGLRHQTVNWTGWDGRGNTQMQAREARYKLIEQHRGECSVILTAHTLEDQAETFLLRLKRGSGVDGLASILPRHYFAFQKSGYWLLRPFLDVSREALRSFLRTEGHDWVEDPSNEDENYDRIEIRKSMRGLTDLGITQEVLASTASHLARVRSSLEEQVRDLAGLALKIDHGDILIDLQSFVSMHKEIQYRLFSMALNWVASRIYKPRFNSLERTLENVISGQPQTLHGCIIGIKKTHIRVTREFNAVSNIRLSFDLDCIWDNRWRFVVKPGVIPAHDWIVRAAGLEGVKWIKSNSDIKLPFQSLKAYPGVFDSKGVVCIPNLVENPLVDSTFCTKLPTDCCCHY